MKDCPAGDRPSGGDLSGGVAVVTTTFCKIARGAISPTAPPPRRASEECASRYLWRGIPLDREVASNGQLGEWSHALAAPHVSSSPRRGGLRVVGYGRCDCAIVR